MTISKAAAYAFFSFIVLFGPTPSNAQMCPNGLVNFIAAWSEKEGCGKVAGFPTFVEIRNQSCNVGVYVYSPYRACVVPYTLIQDGEPNPLLYNECMSRGLGSEIQRYYNPRQWCQTIFSEQGLAPEGEKFQECLFSDQSKWHPMSAQVYCQTYSLNTPPNFLRRYPFAFYSPSIDGYWIPE